jgi:lipoprotein LprG
MTPPTSRTLAAVTLTSALLLSGCTGAGSQESDLSPEEVLAEAKTQLDETSGVNILLATEKLPAGVNGIVSADGVGTHQPAFDGKLKVASGGITLDVEVVAVDGDVHAKLPYTTDFVEVDPRDYQAPDPADLMDTEEGLSSLLTAAEDVEAGEPVRSGELVLTEYTGTVPGEVVARVIPSADPSGTFDATFSVTEDNRLEEAELTGAFYPDAPEVTYSITFEDYGTDEDITAP